MEHLGPHLIIGISYGMLLFLIASGLSLIFGVMGILNMAHGSLYLLGAYLCVLFVEYGAEFWIYIVPAGIIVGLLGVIIERVFLTRQHGNFDAQVLVTIGLMFIFENLFLWFMGPHHMMVTAPSSINFPVQLGDSSITFYRFFIMIVGFIIFVILILIMEKTRAGAIIRAGMDDKEMVTGLGLNYGLVCSAVFFLGACIAGIAGYIAAPWLGAEFRMGLTTLILAIIVVIIGGVGSVLGTLIGAIVVGLIDALGKAYLPQFASFLPYTLFIIILLVRPFGILGRKVS